VKIEEVFDEVAAKMRADFAGSRAALSHGGMKGTAAEEVVRLFLRDYLPAALDVSTGILIDTAGNCTRQLDIIVSDAVSTPILFRSSDIRVIPVECALRSVRSGEPSISLCRERSGPVRRGLQPGISARRRAMFLRRAHGPVKRLPGLPRFLIESTKVATSGAVALPGLLDYHPDA
jgi:Domain of unknown function (DUF6602)